MQGFDIGDVVKTGAGAWSRNVLAFTLIGVVVFIPLHVLSFAGYFISSPALLWLMVPLQLVLNFTLNCLVTGAVTYGVVQDLRGQRVTLAECTQVGAAQLVPLLMVGALTGLVTMVGFMMLVIPGILVMCMLWVVVPVAVIEHKGVMESFSRSAELTRGSRGSILMTVIALGILMAVGRGVLGLFTSFLGPFGALLQSFYSAGVTSVFAAITAAGYYRLRAMRDGVTAQDLAAAFADTYRQR